MEKEIINLGKLPLVNNLFPSKEESLSAKKFDLRIVQKDDLLMKLDTEIPSHEMFDTYLYRSSVNKPYIDHCKKLWESLKKFNPKNIADIGGNDGALLNAFKECSEYGLNLTNIDASFSFKEVNEQKGIKYMQGYWGDTIFDKKFDLITSTNVFQHNPNYEKFIKGIQNNLNGRWVLEFPYFLETVKTNQFDQIYHEHVYYWLVTPIYFLFKKYGLKIIDLSIHEMHGGSMRIISSNKSEDKEDFEKINFFMNQEKEFDFSGWGEKVKAKLKKDNLFINKLTGSVAAFGAAAKGCIYLNCIGENKIEYIIDDTKEKQGLFSPGTGLKILSRNSVEKKPTDNIIILAHNFKKHIAASLREAGYNGKIFAMLPEIEEL